MNEYGWIKRRETLNRAKISEDMDEILKNLKDKEIENVPEQKEFDEEGKELEPQIYIPQAEYTAVCNADFLPMICNDFITEFLYDFRVDVYGLEYLLEVGFNEIDGLN